jgi:hypothetical protein
MHLLQQALIYVRQNVTDCQCQCMRARRHESDTLRMCALALNAAMAHPLCESWQLLLGRCYVVWESTTKQAGHTV